VSLFEKSAPITGRKCQQIEYTITNRLRADERGARSVLSRLPFKHRGFQFQRLMREGESSAILRVRVKQCNVDCVAKVVRKGRKLFHCRVKDLMALSHPNVLRIYDAFEAGGFVFIVLDYCELGSLADVAAAGEVFRTLDSVIALMYRLAQGLAHCHDLGIAHRDVSPADVLVDAHGRPKWAGQRGFARYRTGEPATVCSATGPYRTPEVLLGGAHDPFKADVWSLGIVFFELVAGGLPWPGTAGGAVDAAVLRGDLAFPAAMAPAVRRAIAAMVALEPVNRPSARAVARCGLFARVAAGELAERPSPLLSVGRVRGAPTRAVVRKATISALRKPGRGRRLWLRTPRRGRRWRVSATGQNLSATSYRPEAREAGLEPVDACAALPRRDP